MLNTTYSLASVGSFMKLCSTDKYCIDINYRPHQTSETVTNEHLLAPSITVTLTPTPIS